MTHISFKHTKDLDSEQISKRILFVVVALIAVVFGAFFLIGYDIPYEDDPSFNAPLLTDLVLVFIYVLVTVTLVLAVASVTLSVKTRDKSTQGIVNNVPAAKIALGTTALLFACLCLTFATGSDEPVTVNGTKYADWFWLKTTDMFINTSFVLLAVAVCGVAFGISGYNRKIRKINKR